MSDELVKLPYPIKMTFENSDRIGFVVAQYTRGKHAGDFVCVMDDGQCVVLPYGTNARLVEEKKLH